MYQELSSDHAFTLWLATRSKAKVVAERNVRWTGVEKKILAYHRPKRVKVVKTRKPQRFTQAQIQVALSALQAKEK